MLRILGFIVMIAGLISIATGVVVGQSGVYIPGNILGLFSPVTAIACYGGAVMAFVGFSLAVINNGPRRMV